MSYPYLTDLINALFGTHWWLPIPTFGLMVALALVASTRVARDFVRKSPAWTKI